MCVCVCNRMEKWPALPPCSHCPWRDRLLKRRSWAGFFVRANMMSFSSNDQSFPQAEIATLYPIAKPTTAVTSTIISKSGIEGTPSPLHCHASTATKTIKGMYWIIHSMDNRSLCS